MAEQIGWIGLGSMGSAMAGNLNRHLLKESQSPLHFYNRTASRGAFLAELGAHQEDSISTLVKRCDLIFLSVSDDAALLSTVDQVLGVDQLIGKVVIDTTTVHPNTTKKVAVSLGERGASFLAAPVFGATPVAEAGKLLIAISGPQSAIEKASPYLKGVLARDVLIVSDVPEKAVLLKTIGNFMIAGIMELVAEAHVFAEKSGLEANVLESLLEQNFGALAHSDSQRMTGGVYMPGKGQAPYSGLDLALKDVGHGVSSAQDAGVKLEIGDVILNHLNQAKEYSDEHGGRPLDSSSLYGVNRTKAGLDFANNFVKARDASA